jgi:GH25 family lysozyme M1 (1,4-beta-N-acetylmuramidase)
MTPEKLIDTSKWQGNFQALPLPSYGQAIEEGVTNVAMKVTQGYIIDSMYTYARAECERLDINWTGYHFWVKGDGSRTARAFGHLVKDSTLTPVVDFEPSLTGPLTNGQALYDFIRALEDVIGKHPWIYTGVPYWNKVFPVAPEWLGDYKLWVAGYPLRRPTWTREKQWDMSCYTYTVPSLPIGWNSNQLVAWQFTDSGYIPTFSNKVDLDWYYPDKDI